MFDWSSLDLPRWTPLSTLGSDVEHLTRGLYSADPCVHVLANSAFGSESDPGIGGFLWARSRSVAIKIYERQVGGDVTSSSPPCPPIPESVLGFTPLTFGGVMTAARRAGELAQVAATYAFPDGGFVASQVGFGGREFVFASANPDDAEIAMAVVFRLKA